MKKTKSFGKLGNRLLFSSITSAIIIIVFVIICVTCVRYFLNENIQNQRALDSIDETVNTLHDSLIDQETGQRGYSLTNDAAFLEPYYRGTEKFTLSSDNLKGEMESYPQLSAEISALIDKGEHWQVHYGEPMIKLAKQGEQPSVEFLQSAKIDLDEFRHLSESFFDHVEAERGIVRGTMQRGVNLTLISLVLLTSTIIIINVAISLRGVKSVTKPIIKLSDCVTAYTKHDFSKKIPVYKQTDELSQLIQNVDVMRDELSVSINQLESAVKTDGLTGLFNRRFFDEFLEKEWQAAKAHSKPLSLILFDLDCFKDFNDTYGHLEGDDCLKTISKRIHTYNQGTLNFAARYGGEEFAILLINRTKQEVKAIAENIQQTVEDLHIPHETSFVSDFVTISTGVATVIPTENMESNDLIAMADQALYVSKENGRNQVTLFD